MPEPKRRKHAGVLKALQAFQQPSEPQPSFLERMGGVRGLAGTGIRGLSGLLSWSGGPVGAGISGLGETAAELAEGSELSPSRIAVETGLGAVPLGKLFKAGKVATSAIRGGLYAGIGTGAREWAKDEPLDTGAIATSAALGGVVGGGLAKFMAPAAKLGPPPMKVLRGQEMYEDVARRPLGPTTETLGAGRESYMYQPSAVEVSPRVQKIATKEIAEKLKVAKATAKAAEEAKTAEKIAAARVEAGVEAQPPSFSESISTKIPGGSARMATRYDRPAEEEGTEELSKLLTGSGKSAKWTETEETLGESLVPPTPAKVAPETLQETLRPTGVEPVVPKEARIAAKRPSRTPIENFNTWGKWGQEDNARVAKLLGKAEEQPPIPAVGETPIAQETAAALIPEAPAAETAVAKFFKTRGGASGLNYRLAKEAEAAGGPTANYAREARLREVAAEKAGIPTKTAVPGAQIGQGIPGATPAGDRATTGILEPSGGIPGAVPEPIIPDWVKQQSGLVDRMAKLGKGEKGGINPSLALRLGLGAAGAAVGGAADPFGNPLLSAAAGGAAGFAAPSVLKAFGAHPSTLENLEGSTTTPEGLKEKATQILRSMPNIQRVNYLANLGYPANALAGPYGSLMMAAVEKTLAGDPLGPQLLKKLNPINFAKDWHKAIPEARNLIAKGELGRAEMGQGTGLPASFSHVLRMPAVGMVAGDTASRNLLQDAGVPEAMAREITLTSEPFTTTGHSASRLKGWLADMAFPFKRTPINIAEQGGLRTPGLGFLMHKAREKAGIPAETLRTKLTQQALGAGVGLGAGAISANLSPENAKILRPYVTNLGGQYALPASIGWAGGLGVAQGKDPALAAATGAVNALPMPTTQTLTDFKDFIFGTATTPPFSVKNLPRGTTPGVLRQVMDAYKAGAFAAPARR